MNKFKLLLGVIILCGAAQLHAVEGDIQARGYVNLLLNNQYLIENARLVMLAEEAFNEGKYEDAISFAAQAERFADLYDEYVNLQMVIRDANRAINAAQARMNWARSVGIPSRFPEEFAEAEAELAQAIEFRSNENWVEARAAALRAIAILEALPGEVPLPAQILVRTWVHYRDCLWNIAAMPEVYGDPWQWPRLYDANRDKMPQRHNPDLIHPEMILDIPSIRGELRHGILVRD
ncbi:MAG: LysM peptidoglycan-binding domain-containing protein [Treponema sp.]|nr:LysM peptidoglycan-binding domain-containing protein [Treponema sp.]